MAKDQKLIDGMEDMRDQKLDRKCREYRKVVLERCELSQQEASKKKAILDYMMEKKIKRYKHNDKVYEWDHTQVDKLKVSAAKEPEQDEEGEEEE